MSCGDIVWWRAPDLKALLVRHGAAEHLVVQFDFLVQVHRDGRAEFSIPGASKTASGNTGFADIVSVATGEIWEIKPERLEECAAKEAEWYTRFAKAGCGPHWRPGTAYTTSTLFGGGGVVYRLEGSGNKAELIAEQRRPGAVVYFWRINGSKVSSLIPYFAWALREQIVKDFFGGQPPQPLAGAKPPNNLPPGKFKPPVLTPDGCIPQLGGLVPALNRSIRTTCAQTVIDNSAVMVLIDSAFFNALVGAGIVARQVASMQVKTDPTVTLYRKALQTLTALGVTHGAVAAMYLLEGLFALGVGAVTELGAGGGVIAVTCEATPVAAAPALAAEGLVGSFVAGVRTALSAQTMIAGGATLVVLAIPRASRADPGTPASFQTSLPKFIAVPPGKPVGRVGQSIAIDNGEWVIAGIARTPPD